MPKSGSTFLSEVLRELTGFKRATALYVSERNEPDLYVPRLLETYARPTIHQHHTRATAGNIKLMKLFRVRPVVLVRNLFDVVVSTRDHFHREGTVTPVCYADKRFMGLDEESQCSFIIDLCLPWYLSFYLSWCEAMRTRQIEALWVTYEELIGDAPGTIARIADFYGIRTDEARIEGALERARGGNIRLNKGVCGRGQEELTERQKGRIRSLARYYPGTDFSRIGL
jgi:hypothetical protein